jgi:hypothetical protein
MRQWWWLPLLLCELLLDEPLLDELEWELVLLLGELACELPPLDQLPLCDGADAGGLVCTGG